MADEEALSGDMKVGTDAIKLAGDKMTDAGPEERNIIELVISVQQAGNERGKRLYFDSKSVEKIREKCGDDFFLFNERILLAFVNSADGKITVTSLKGIYKNYL
ncbi:MAG TPA: hypothetical protein VMW67_06585 [Desulfobacteria bacterium]|nr:hypothetical protein [Desulfobacteria bacterium]